MEEELFLLRRNQIISMHVRNRTRRDRSIGARHIFKERELYGAFFTLIPRMREIDSNSFKNYLRVSPSQLDEIVNLVSPLIYREDTRFKKSVSPSEKVCLTLRFLASGDSMKSLSYQFRLGASTVTSIISETCSAIWSTLCKKWMKAPESAEDWLAISEGFDEKWQFPHCLGAIDGKHVIIQAPPNSGTLFYNYKNSYSIVLMAICTSKYVFSIINVGDYGHNSDGGIFSQSAFGKALYSGELLLPSSSSLPGTKENFPYVFVADEAFPLKPNLLRPYSARDLNMKRRIFNYRLCRARRVIENTFEILSARWRILRKPILAKPTTIDNIIKCCCVLHNFIMLQDNDFEGDRETGSGQIIPGNWRLEVENENSAFQPLVGSQDRHYSGYASSIRDLYADYFISEIGSLQAPWQYDKINNYVNI